MWTLWNKIYLIKKFLKILLLKGGFQLIQILGLLGMYFDAVVVEVKTFLLLFISSLAILWPINISIPPLDLKMLLRIYRLPDRLPQGPSKIEWQIIAFATADIYFFHFFAKNLFFRPHTKLFSQIWFTLIHFHFFSVIWLTEFKR